MTAATSRAARHPAGFYFSNVAWPLLTAVLLLSLVSPLLAQDANLTQGCVAEFDPTVDYFPHKATLLNASGLEIEYHGHYKLVRTLQPWPGAAAAVEYLLLQCGTPLPAGHADALAVEVPVRSVISLATTQLPNLLDLGRLDQLIAVDSGNYVNTPEVVAMLQDGALAEVGNGASINVELVLVLAPDLVLANGFNPETDAHPSAAGGRRLHRHQRRLAGAQPAGPRRVAQVHRALLQRGSPRRNALRAAAGGL